MLVVRSICLAAMTCLLVTHVTEAAHSADELRSKGSTALSKHKYRDAIKYFSALIDLEPSEAKNYYKRATCYLRIRKFNSALKDLTHSVNLDPSYITARLHKGRVLRMQGHCQEAMDELEAALKLKPNHKSVNDEHSKATHCQSHSSAAQEAAERNDWEVVTTAASAALEGATESLYLYLLRAKANSELGDVHNVLYDTRIVLKMDDNNLDALLLRGNAYFQLGDASDVETALSHYRRGLKLDPEHKFLKRMYKRVRKVSRAFSNAEKFINEKEYQRALDSLDKLKTLEPDHNTIKLRTAMRTCDVYIKMEDGSRAVSACTEAIEMDERNAEAWAKRGEAKTVAEDYEGAVHDYQKASELQQDNAEYKEKVQQAQVALKRSKEKDYYKILGVKRNASPQQIKRAFRKKALLLHPDKVAEDKKEQAEKKFHELGEAYEILSDPESKGRYDRGEDVKPQQGFNPNQAFHTFFQGGGGQHFTFTF